MSFTAAFPIPYKYIYGRFEGVRGGPVSMRWHPLALLQAPLRRLWPSHSQLPALLVKYSGQTHVSRPGQSPALVKGVSSKT
jgi:hypothetical protein